MPFLLRALFALAFTITVSSSVGAQIVVGSWNIQTLATNGVVFPGDYQRTDSDFALLRMARELAAVRKVDDDQSVKELSEFLAKNAKRAQAAGEKAEEEAAAEEAA